MMKEILPAAKSPELPWLSRYLRQQDAWNAPGSPFRGTEFAWTWNPQFFRVNVYSLHCFNRFHHVSWSSMIWSKFGILQYWIMPQLVSQSYAKDPTLLNLSGPVGDDFFKASTDMMEESTWHSRTFWFSMYKTVLGNLTGHGGETHRGSSGEDPARCCKLFRAMIIPWVMQKLVVKKLLKLWWFEESRIFVVRGRKTISKPIKTSKHSRLLILLVWESF